MHSFHSAFLVIVACGFVCPIYGFAPNSASNLVLKLYSFEFQTGSITHPDITESAILQVVKELLEENPNMEDSGSTTRINMLASLTTENLIKAYFGDSSDDLADKFKGAIDEINEANEGVDLGDLQKNAAAHFDSERIQEGKNRVVMHKKRAIIAIMEEDYELARMEIGQMLHTLQDFYSHSNWIEIGNTSPYTVLGDESSEPENIASPTRETCTDCTQGDKILMVGLFGGADYHYECSDNIRSDVNDAHILTSGYYKGQKDKDGNVITKPTGKCSHGGFRDASSDLSATGGINKDSTTPEWSPHADLHSDAAAVAISASRDLLKNIRDEVRNDTKFANFLNINLVKQQTISSIAFVIDTTGSMSEELPEIQATIPEIRVFLEEIFAKNADVKLILVPFNDPGKEYIYYYTT